MSSLTIHAQRDQTDPVAEATGRWPGTASVLDLVLTRVSPGRSFGRIRLSLPEYRLVSRRPGEILGADSIPPVAEGDTIRLYDR